MPDNDSAAALAWIAAHKPNWDTKGASTTEVYPVKVMAMKRSKQQTEIYADPVHLMPAS